MTIQPRNHILHRLRIIILSSVLYGATIPLCHAQDTAALASSGPNKTRVWLVSGGNVALWTGSFLALNKAWYADYSRSSFHFFNDNGEWNQMDKLGHVWTSYHVSRLCAEMWEWTGMSRTKSILLGGASGIAYQSIIEIQDGFSSEWGFSWGDMTANVVGAAAYAAQELGWKEQRIQVKMNYWPHNYYTDELRTRRDQLFGKSLPERLLKDYNSQVYWFSANMHSFLPNSGLPKWLNIAVGYSADGMYGGMDNTWKDKEGVLHDRTDIPRMRHFYLSPDIDLTKIKTRSKFLRSAFFVLNMIKIPAPAISINGKGKVKGYFFR
ncbi:MAG: DUF2279 domain-containing protein [Chitinophagaceae bacterium]